MKPSGSSSCPCISPSGAAALAAASGSGALRDGAGPARGGVDVWVPFVGAAPVEVCCCERPPHHLPTPDVRRMRVSRTELGIASMRRRSGRASIPKRCPVAPGTMERSSLSRDANRETSA